MLRTPHRFVSRRRDPTARAAPAPATRPGRVATIASLAWLASLAAGCSGGGGGEGGAGIASDGAGALPERYVSGLDSSLTANAVAAGVDPRFEFLPDTFACHDEADPDVSAPDLEVWFSGDGRYATAAGEGRVGLDEGEEAPSREYRFRGGPLDGERTFLGFDDFGQSFGVDAGGAEYRCYQRGASAARALALAHLATPQPGDYRCREAGGGGEATLALGADGSYAVGGEIGRWTLSDVVGNASGRMAFAGGPLDGEGARYAEEPDNGYRSFAVRTSRSFGPLGLGGASSELALTCESLGPPVALPLYGPAAAPALPGAPSGAPTGFWWYEDVLTSTNDSHFEVRHLLLGADGYGYAGTPPATGVDCGRTRPNGLPFCDAWTLEGDVLRLFRPYGRVVELRLGTDGGTLVEIDGERARAVRPVDPAALVGERENLAYYQSGCTGLGYCSYGLTTRTLHLTDEGRFLFTVSSDGGSSFDGGLSGGVSTYAFGSASASSIGAWSAAGNVLELAFDSGRTLRHFVVAGDGTVGVDDLMY